MSFYDPANEKKAVKLERKRRHTCATCGRALRIYPGEVIRQGRAITIYGHCGVGGHGEYKCVVTEDDL